MKKIYLLLLSAIFACAALAQSETREITWDGTMREYIEYLPSSYTGDEAYPVVFALHGLGDNMNNFSGTGMHLIADTADIICITPQALMATYMGYEIGTAWNSGASAQGVVPNQDVDDVGFLMAVLDSLDTHYNIDTNRIYFFGYSMGGYMCNKMACEVGDRINAIASVSGTMGNAYNPAPQHHTACLHFHGTADGTVAYSNNDSGMDADSLVNFWVNHNGNDTEAVLYEYPDNADDGLTFERYVYPNGTEQVAHIKVIDGAHEWYYIPNNDIDYAREIWTFFTQRFSEESDNASTGTHQQSDVSVFPNPAENAIQLNFSGENHPQNLHLYDMQGRIIRSWEINSSTPQLNLQGIPSGSYVLRPDGGDFSKKMVVK
ncbi:MAG: T9SS type A sorting domain-containing protein [Bacteroidales bacterium]